MRSSPSSTVSLDAPLSALSRSKAPSAHVAALMDAGVRTVQDLLWALPLRAIPTPRLRPFREAREGEMFLGQGRVIHCELRPAFGRRTKGRLLLYTGHLVVKELSGDGTLSLRFFNIYPQQKKQLEGLEQVWFLGQLQEWRAQLQIINPKVIPLLDASWPSTLGDWLIEYPTISKVPGSFTAKLIAQLPREVWTDIHPSYPTDALTDLSLGRAFQVLHAQLPPSELTPELRTRAVERLAYEEFFVDQLKITTRRRFIKKKTGAPVHAAPDTLTALEKLLPFTLTDDQAKVIQEILADMGSGHPMMRMLQGDVGCGKTIVAFLVALVACAQGGQVALMCPTEALAQQHAQTLAGLFGKLPFLTPSLLLGSMKKKEKDAVQKALASGASNFVIGTHALFQESVAFQRLTLAVIDEQHKFGVEQRLALTGKGAGTHCLIMSATPIPRTLSLAQYGDLDFSTIKHLPAGRKGIKTRIVAPANYGKYVDFIRQRLALGDQGYFVFPAIDESETLDLQNVTEAFQNYREVFPGVPMATLHGKMKADDKAQVVEAFTRGELKILIATSVIEVGINVPNAAFMCVYHPERFGLSSLHQLRGRVGRGEKPGFCFLVLDSELGEAGLQRLAILEQTTDGFAIAEADLQNRGEGDLFGVDQSGTTVRRRVADFQRHSHILEKVYRDVQELQRTQPEKIDPILLKLARDQKILDTI